MATTTPFSALAASNAQYISDVKIVSGTYDTSGERVSDPKENAKTMLADAGYKMLETPISSDDNVYLGYKTTTNPDEAITDISSVKMKDGYTMSDYEKIKAKLKEDYAQVLTYLMDGIREFRANKKAGSPAALYAYKMLNLYKEDDSGKLMGDFLMDEGLSEDSLFSVLMEASGAVSGMIREYIAVGCTAYGKDNWMQRLSKNGPDDSLSDNYFDKADILDQKLAVVRDALTIYNNYVDEYGADVTADDLKAVLSDSDFFNYCSCAAIYTILHGYSYGDTNLADFILNSTVYDLYPMAKVLTDAEYEMMYADSIKTFIRCAPNDSAIWDQVLTESNGTLGGDTVISVYTGVNRDLMKGNIGMTNQATRDSTIYGDDYSWFENPTVKSAVLYAGVERHIFAGAPVY